MTRYGPPDVAAYLAPTVHFLDTEEGHKLAGIRWEAERHHAFGSDVVLDIIKTYALTWEDRADGK